jgi:hypothetical protein
VKNLGETFRNIIRHTMSHDHEPLFYSWAFLELVDNVYDIIDFAYLIRFDLIAGNEP